MRFMNTTPRLWSLRHFQERQNPSFNLLHSVLLWTDGSNATMAQMLTVVLLFISNAFMTFAWYGHLKHLRIAHPWAAAGAQNENFFKTAIAVAALVYNSTAVKAEWKSAMEGSP